MGVGAGNLEGGDLLVGCSAVGSFQPVCRNDGVGFEIVAGFEFSQAVWVAGAKLVSARYKFEDKGIAFWFNRCGSPELGF